MTTWTEEIWKKALQDILDRSAKDPEFRALCMSDANAAIREVCGQEPPADGPKVRFAEAIEEQVVLLPPAGDKNLAESELETVSAAGARMARGLLLNPQAAYGTIIWSPQLPGSWQTQRR